MGKLRIRIYRIDRDEVTVECLDRDSLETLGKPPYQLGIAALHDEWSKLEDATAGTTNPLLTFKARNLASLDEYIEGRLLDLSFLIKEKL